MRGTNSVVAASDGFASIALSNGVGDASFKVGLRSGTTNVLTLTNLTTGESQGIDIDGTAIATNDTQTVNFDNLGAVVTLNSAFAKGSRHRADQCLHGRWCRYRYDQRTCSCRGADSSHRGSVPVRRSPASIDATSAAAAVFSIGGFSGTVDLHFDWHQVGDPVERFVRRLHPHLRC